MKRATVLFDLDGTLIDTVELILDSYRETLSSHRLPPQPDSYFLSRIGMPLKAVFHELAPEIPTLDLMATYREHNRVHHDGAVSLYPGVLELLESLSQTGARLGIVTSKIDDDAERGLEVCGIRDYFEVVVGAESVERHKPHPEPVLTALEKLDGSAAQSAYVGDSPFDLRAGRAAGVRTGGVLWGPFSLEQLQAESPDFLATTPAEVLVSLRAFL